MQNKRWIVISLIVCAFLFLAACSGGETESQTEFMPSVESESASGVETVPADAADHSHEFVLTGTVDGTCAEQGYDRYACSCGMSDKELIPAAHSYRSVVDVSGQYTKTVCDFCGDYKIVRNQEYLYNIDYENAISVEEAAKQPPNLEFYVMAGSGGATVENDGENSYMRIYQNNYYVRDKSGVFMSGKTFVLSMDIKVEQYAAAELLSIVYQSGSNWAYTSGLIRLKADGTLGFFANGNGKYTGEVRLSGKGYDNITVVGDLESCLFDVYVNEKLVREDILYRGPTSSSAIVYIRYFDQKKNYVACVDNLKFYQAETPEFIVPNSGIVFSE